MENIMGMSDKSGVRKPSATSIQDGEDEQESEPNFGQGLIEENERAGNYSSSSSSSSDDS